MKRLLPILLLALSLAGQTLPQSHNLGGGCKNQWQETVFPTIGLDSTGTHVLYLFDAAVCGVVFSVFDVLGGAQPFYPMPLSMWPFGADRTCFLRVQWCAVISTASGMYGSFPVPPWFHGPIRCQQMLFDPNSTGGFYMSDVAELIL